MSESAILTPTIVEPDDGFTLRLQRKPEVIVAEARLCADALIAAVKRNGWVQKFGGRDHLFFEAWSFLASMYRVTPRTCETRLVQIGEVTGYEAFAEAFHVPSGIVIGKADSMCLDDEENWDMRPVYEYDEQLKKRVQVGERPVPLFQLRSMAQTRAQAKALKGPFSWIVAMAGYAPTPAEEMGGRRTPSGEGQPIQQPREKTQPAAENGNGHGAKTITGKQASRIWAIGFSQGVDKKIIGQILRAHGFERAEDVTTDKYEEIIAAVENAGAGAAQ
jgi:hypothetical protein